MNVNSDMLRTQSWYEKSGFANDVIISSRVRISRNLSHHPFPEKLSTDDEKKVLEEIVEAFEQLPYEKKFRIFYFDDLNETERNLISGRNILGEDLQIKRNKAVAVSEDKEVVALINQEDHLKIVSIKSGLSLKEAWEQVDRVDSLLENKISYSVSGEFGYLTSSLYNVGTGMKASILVHLPGLVMTSLLSEMFKILREKGLSTRLYGLPEEENDGTIYEIYNYFTIGSTEEEIIQILCELSSSILNLERKMRGIVYEKKRKRLEDRIFRSLGILKYSRSISQKEAYKLLSLVRFGISLNIVADYTMEQITALLMSAYMNPKALSAENALSKQDDVDPDDFLRAQAIRDILVS
jgi:protein arginine kinase